MNRIMAFWKYDMYPYLLWGEVVEFKAKGSIVAKGYEPMAFMPEFILEYEEGLKLSVRLETLRKNYNAQKKSLLKTYQDLATEVVSKCIGGK